MKNLISTLLIVFVIQSHAMTATALRDDDSSGGCNVAPELCYTQGQEPTDNLELASLTQWSCKLVDLGSMKVIEGYGNSEYEALKNAYESCQNLARHCEQLEPCSRF